MTQPASTKTNEPMIVGNPAAVRQFVDSVPHEVASNPYASALYGIPVIEDCLLPAEVPTGKTVFPKDRFVEYEESDAAWAVPLGLAKPETKPMVYLINEVMRRFEVDIFRHMSIPSRLFSDAETNYSSARMGYHLYSRGGY